MDRRFIAPTTFSLALSLCVSACATGSSFGPTVGSSFGTTAAPRLLSNDLHVGGLDERTRFELDDADSPRTTKRGASEDRVDTPAKQRRRKVLYFLGLGAAGFGVVGVTAFGIGGRIVQAQVNNGYDDGTLTHEREDQLNTTGAVMNGMAIGSAVLGLAGVILSATMYGIDHARCGDLPPRRKDDCRDEGAVDEPAPAQTAEPTDAPGPKPIEPAPKIEPTPAPEAGPEPEPKPEPTPGSVASSPQPQPTAAAAGE
ncbi:hypothetical protein [Paraliomyxa miuraensis]|uniref:hypothetical protein n=1 Tax=Paraliomyxa miuraensis TaxID=376150 RepID=UPI002254C27E|nr:hypothetical protein [Paraliomyxa miuraensis]MCX4243685.1 hypothetical protein [Paraliomyxa miuraensis]